MADDYLDFITKSMIIFIVFAIFSVLTFEAYKFFKKSETPTTKSEIQPAPTATFEVDTNKYPPETQGRDK